MDLATQSNGNSKAFIGQEKETKLRAKGYEEAANCLKELHKTVKYNATQFFNKKIDSQTFKDNCFETIQKTRPELEEHRGAMKLLPNFIRMIQLLIPTSLIYKKPIEKFLFFKIKTDSVKKIDSLTQTIEGACKPFCVNAKLGEPAVEFDSESIHSRSPIM